MKKGKRAFLLLFCFIFLSGFSLPGLPSNKDSDVISIAGSITTESQILSSIVSGMIEHYTDQPTSVINNLGTAQISHRALINGDADIAAARYTGTDVTTILQMDAIKEPEKTFDVTKKEFKSRYDQVRFPSYGFDNTFAFMVRQDTADKYDLEKVSDLEEISDQLTVGTDRPWLTREGDGYPGFIQEYGFEFNQMLPMQIGLVYDAVAAGSVDVVLGYSTDGRVASNNLVMLEDDRQFFPPYDATIIANQEFLDQYPEAEDILDKLVGAIDTETMQELNYQADNNLVEPSIVAEQFLEDNDYFEDQ
ncbi:osmoprotectant ABC transporter substrate-binding protein [Tetragenococcus koreensis]|uniref:osmoprotectant ABC transporter substrate-binding protein n=1 Tax=Tetragenococcus koreensis TaxID=290335 RepID=UPI000F4E549A|nr:osmoprotectant ABC transporter substrate-binding protein [Tetragenococcus koreensis]AYW45330.1 osmoprotectant ABC transporter substrate-binding protein [Tetragenococcus koreensis]MCF1617038.1 osmoprotectant ABC transporter substrate-binding protein [Tetragenococcus koreensis]MCF1620068.1 osmoprotectant ABC transporter substrate-binding protein [Tetragenococcus koreensis]MCF1621897.1 osmoprotectant ABC transporter substrate-binding protein [Tetragenococcus koreensis]MCF1626608.1 osmoprotecta